MRQGPREVKRDCVSRYPRRIYVEILQRAPGRHRLPLAKKEGNRKREREREGEGGKRRTTERGGGWKDGDSCSIVHATPRISLLSSTLVLRFPRNEPDYWLNPDRRITYSVKNPPLRPSPFLVREEEPRSFFTDDACGVHADLFSPLLSFFPDHSQSLHLSLSLSLASSALLPLFSACTYTGTYGSAKIRGCRGYTHLVVVVVVVGNTTTWLRSLGRARGCGRAL